MKHYLETVRWGVIPVINYKGHLLERIIGGYKILGSIAITPDEVDKKIESVNKSLNNSIKQ